MTFRTLAAFLAVFLTTTPADASAQVRSLEEAQQELQRGDQVQVIDDSGAIVGGRFDGASGSSLRLLRRGAILEFRSAQISRIRKARDESDGILIGLGIGAAAGLAYVALDCGGSSESRDCRRAGSAVVIGPSAAAGALIDRALRKFETIFDRRSPSVKHVRLSPILTAHRKGVALTLVY